MEMSRAGVELLIKLEGLKLKVYKDSAGLKTIGVGHLLTKSELNSGKIRFDLSGSNDDVNGTFVRDYRNGLSRSDAIAILKWDISRFVDCVNAYIDTPINQNQFDALVSFSFNIGKTAFKHSTLLRLLNKGQHEAIPKQMLRWIHAGGRKVNGLVNRRRAEIKLWNTPADHQVSIKKDDDYKAIKAIAKELGVW